MGHRQKCLCHLLLFPSYHPEAPVNQRIGGLLLLAWFAPLPAVTGQELAPVAVTAQDMPVPVVKLKLHPAGPSVPAFKVRLLPELRDLKPGNAVVPYYRSFSPE